MISYQTDPRMRYASEEVWFAASLYVQSWEEDFHQLMLNDQVRMQAYEKAIKAAVRPGMVVCDVGTGTGILAQWALEAGARMVHGIEVNEKIASRARDRMKRAGFADRFRVWNALSHNVTLPEKVDVVMSEILGNLGDNEGMTSILNDARARFLKPGGRMLPRRAVAFLAPVSAPKAHGQIQRHHCRGLSNRYDLDDLLDSLHVGSPFQIYYDVIIPSRTHLAPPTPVALFAFDGCDPECYSRQLVFTVQRPGLFTGFKGYFWAELTEGAVLDISGDDIEGRTTSDSWKHCYLPVEQPVAVRPRDVITVTYATSRPRRKAAPFGQRYSWTGSVQRGGRIISSFHNGMEAGQLGGRSRRRRHLERAARAAGREREDRYL
jgi:type I protein arginine methyltransferase